MPCYYPVTALQPTTGGPLLFPKPAHLYLYNDYRTLQIPCGQCHGCRLKRSRQWAIRCLHEKQMHEHSCYITLTYNEQHLPLDLSLRYEHFQRFIKRLRKQIWLLERALLQRQAANLNAIHHSRHASTDAPGGPGENQNRLPALHVSFGDNSLNAKPIKFYMCGEYGEQHSRPHYHALLFGVDFADKLLFKQTLTGHNIYTSPLLQKLWPFGFSSIGQLTFESAAYVARYVMKKLTGDDNNNELHILNLDTGEIHIRKKEFNMMSRRPGIGSSWMTKYASDIYTTGKVINKGYPLNPPRYYDKLYNKVDAATLEGIKHARYLESLAYTEHQTPERLSVQEQVQLAKTKSLKRKL